MIGPLMEQCHGDAHEMLPHRVLIHIENELGDHTVVDADQRPCHRRGRGQRRRQPINLGTDLLDLISSQSRLIGRPLAQDRIAVWMASNGSAICGRTARSYGVHTADLDLWTKASASCHATQPT